jgi:hypothetical protein
MEDVMFNKKDDRYILSKDAAEKVIDDMLDFLEIDIDEIEEKDTKDMIKKNLGRVIKAIRLGRLEIKHDGGFKVVQHLRNDTDKQNSLVFKVPGAIAKKAMADKSQTDFYGRIYAMMGSACGLGETAIDKLDPVDLSVVEVLGAIFLSV